MNEMTVNSLNVDLIQDRAMIGLTKEPDQPVGGKFAYTNLTVNVPLVAPGNQPESDLRRHAIDQAKNALREAIRVLDAYPA